MTINIQPGQPLGKLGRIWSRNTSEKWGARKDGKQQEPPPRRVLLLEMREVSSVKEYNALRKVQVELGAKNKENR